MNSKKTNQRIKWISETYGGDQHKQIRALKRLIQEGQQTGDAFLVGMAYYQLAVIYNDLEQTDNFFSCAFKAAEILKDFDEPVTVARSMVALGFAYDEQGNAQMALAGYDKACQIIRRHRIKGGPANIAINNLATCYHNVGDYKTGIKLLKESIRRTLESHPDDYTNLAMSTINLANCYKDSGDPQEALKTLDTMFDWVEKIPYRPLVCDFYLRRALLYYELNERQQGDRCLDDAFDRFPKDSYPHPLYEDFCKVLKDLAKNRDKARADRIYALMQIYAEKRTNTMEQLIAYRAMAEYHKSFGEASRAFECYEHLDKLFEDRLNDLTGIQFNVYKRMKSADAEIGRVKKTMRQKEAQFALEPLTGLLNRSALLKVSSEFIESASKRKQKVGAIFIDIDCFKGCNDTYGHARGDEIIREIARICRTQENANVRFARYGGDEYFGITKGLTDEQVAGIAQNICRAARDENIPNATSLHDGRLTLSVGIVNVLINDRADTIIEIANFADKAVYHAKNHGKNAIYKLDYSETDQKGNYVKIDF